jgi:hypothetical protein
MTLLRVLEDFTAAAKRTRYVAARSGAIIFSVRGERQ